MRASPCDPSWHAMSASIPAASVEVSITSARRLVSSTFSAARSPRAMAQSTKKSASPPNDDANAPIASTPRAGVRPG
ncbi:MAG: hypothetical protein IT379_25850 [Deltaproteobacteria bacterium]|nr:hypothetical protein [Deltaproteobacteria bacterium]